MIKITVDKDNVHTEAEGKRLEILTELCCGVIDFINDMTQDKPEVKPKIVDMFIIAIKEFS